jgi:hypothetical protein
VAAAGPVDSALKDDGDFSDPQAVDPATDRPLDGSTDAAAVSADSADSVPDNDELAADANTDADDAVAAGDDTGTAPLADAPAASTTADDASAPVVPVPVPVGEAAADATPATDAASATDTAPGTTANGDRLPGTVPAPELTSIFHPEDATSFHDRWRDVQLKFVDSPKEATTEAAGLLDEAVEKLANSLRDQKAKLHQVDSDDTEQLRVELRGYRDILNRVLGL